MAREARAVHGDPPLALGDGPAGCEKKVTGAERVSLRDLFRFAGRSKIGWQP